MSNNSIALPGVKNLLKIYHGWPELINYKFNTITKKCTFNCYNISNTDHCSSHYYDKLIFVDVTILVSHYRKIIIIGHFLQRFTIFLIKSQTFISRNYFLVKHKSRNCDTECLATIFQIGHGCQAVWEIARHRYNDVIK